MKKRYQMEQQRAVNEFRRFANEDNPTVQMPLPMREVLSITQSGVGNLVRQAGLELMKLVMDEEVRHLAGQKHEQHEGRQAHRWGREEGYCVIDGRKVRIERTRLRNSENGEVRLGSYELFRRGTPVCEQVWDKVMHGLSTRNYEAVVRDL